MGVLRAFLRMAIVSSLTLTAIVGCTSIPSETVELSAELGRQINVARSAHLAAVRSYFGERKNRIDRFVSREWLPVFAENVFNQPTIKAAWLRIVQQGSEKERLDFIVGLGPRLQRRIDGKRTELTQPILEAERLLISEIDAHYQDMTTANATLTSFLASSADLDQTRARLVGKIPGAGRFSGYFTDVERMVSLITAGRAAFDESRADIEKIMNRLRKISEGGST